MSKQQEIEKFLEKKGIKFKDLTKRQQEILLNEKFNMWDFYTWNLK